MGGNGPRAAVQDGRCHAHPITGDSGRVLRVVGLKQKRVGEFEEREELSGLIGSLEMEVLWPKLQRLLTMTSQAAHSARTAEQTGVPLLACRNRRSWSLLQLSAKKIGQPLRLSANTTTPTRHNNSLLSL